VIQQRTRRVAIICCDREFETLNDVLYQLVPDALQGMETHYEVEIEDGLTIFVPYEWTEGRMHVLQFPSSG